MLHRYIDPVEGFEGFVALDGDGHRLAAGGLRVQAGLDGATVAELARAMTLKQRLLGLGVDGAKAGIDYDPHGPGKRQAMSRFLRFLAPFLLDRLSLGPDLGAAWDEVEEAARSEGIPSAKMAIARAQGLDEDDFWCRLRLLDTAFDGATLAQRRSGHALAHAALAANELAGGPRERMRVAVQGFGTLGRGAVLSLAQAGPVVVAVADEHGCLLSHSGLPPDSLLATPPGSPLPASGVSATAAPPQAVFEVPADVVVLAACEDAMTLDQAACMRASAVAVGANLALTDDVEAALHAKGTFVVPDFVGGCGGSASMDALFGPPSCPSVGQVLHHVAARMRALVGRIFHLSQEQGVRPRQAALLMCASQPAPPSGKPYGRWSPVPAGGCVEVGVAMPVSLSAQHFHFPS